MDNGWINNDPITVAEIDNLIFCLEYRTVEINGKEVPLTATEFDIFALLLLNPKRVFTYEIISDMVWQEPYQLYSPKVIRNHINNIRKKLRIGGCTREYIKSVHSVGYKFDGISHITARNSQII